MRHLSSFKMNNMRPSLGQNTGKIVGGLVLGTAVGVALGTLFAPGNGADTRRKIAEKGNDLFCSVKDQLSSMMGKNTKDPMEDIKDQSTAYAEEPLNKMDSEFIG